MTTATDEDVAPRRRRQLRIGAQSVTHVQRHDILCEQQRVLVDVMDEIDRGTDMACGDTAAAGVNDMYRRETCEVIGQLLMTSILGEQRGREPAC